MRSFDLAKGKKEELKNRIQKNEVAFSYPMSIVITIVMSLWKILWM